MHPGQLKNPHADSLVAARIEHPCTSAVPRLCCGCCSLLLVSPLLPPCALACPATRPREEGDDTASPLPNTRPSPPSSSLSLFIFDAIVGNRPDIYSNPNLPTLRMMSDYEVQTIKDNMSEFNVKFHGPKDSACPGPLPGPMLTRLPSSLLLPRFQRSALLILSIKSLMLMQHPTRAACGKSGWSSPSITLTSLPRSDS